MNWTRLSLFFCLVGSLFAQDKLVVWHAYRGAERIAFEKLVDQYNQTQPAITVSTLAVPYDALADKITAAVPRGKGPDVFIFAQDRLGGWVESGQTVEPLDFFLEDETRESFLPVTLQAMTYKDSVYGLPFNYKMIVMIYNKKLIQKPPTTSTELVTVAQQLTKPDAGQFGLAYSFNDFFYHAALMNAFGGGVFSQSKPSLNSKPNIEALNYLMKWFRQDKILPEDPSVALITSLFNEGKAAMVFSGPWFLGEIESGIDYGLAPLPYIEEAKSPMKPWVTVEGMFITAPSKHKEEAYAFIQYATSKTGAGLMAREAFQLPANAAIYQEKDIAENPTLSVFRKQLDASVAMPNLAEMTMMWSPATTAMNTLCRGTDTPQEAMDAAQAKLVEAIGKLRKAQ
ncbi:MAG: extracellular solute-binding protein [Acidobacteria bacterium]|nr:extracellular solute-binding protein [Acidobacteriota bacterium]MCB9397650.1 extracellular solute-binding protein [Acidobacteriota bacterium]